MVNNKLKCVQKYVTLIISLYVLMKVDLVNREDELGVITS